MDGARSSDIREKVPIDCSPAPSRAGSSIIRTPLASPAVSPEALVHPDEVVPSLDCGPPEALVRNGSAGAALVDAVVHAAVDAASVVGDGGAASCPSASGVAARTRSKSALGKVANATEVAVTTEVAALSVAAGNESSPPVPLISLQPVVGNWDTLAKVDSVLPVGTACDSIVISASEDKSTYGVMVKRRRPAGKVVGKVESTVLTGVSNPSVVVSAVIRDAVIREFL